MLVLEQVKKHYCNFDLDCSLEIKPGMITGLIGQNGAGKTTAIKLLLGLIGPEEGNIKAFGKPVKEMKVEDRRKFGVVLADSGFSGYLMVKDVISVLEGLYPAFQKDTFLSYCERFQLPLDKKIKEFSTGMKRKLQLITALTHEAEVLILDEPTAGLDVIVREEILDLLREYMEQGERSILISSHISSDLETLCDDFYMIHDGRIVMHEETDRLLSDYGVLKLTDEQYKQVDSQYFLRKKKETYGYSCLTDQKQFYMENYPKLQLERGSIDNVITMMIRGEAK